MIHRKSCGPMNFIFSGHGLSAIMKVSRMILIDCAVVSLLLYSLVIVQAQSPTTTKFVTYDGSKYGIIIQYPENWKIKEDPSGAWFVSPVDETGNVRIESQPSLNASLALLVQEQLLQSKESYKELTVTSSNITTLSNIPANRTDYKFKIEVPKFLGADVYDYIAIQISAIRADKFYTFTYFSTTENYHLFLPIAQKMLSSLRIE
jgi:hypothetical protein